MNIAIFLTFLLLGFTQCDKIQAQLKIITFQPLTFKLTFSQVLMVPQFLLLFNQLPINCQVNDQKPASQYIIQCKDQNINGQGFDTEKYVIMFTNPLDVANGTLALSSFSVRATSIRTTTQYAMQPLSQKVSPFKYQSDSKLLDLISIIICSMIYFLTYTTQVGLITYVFLTIYVYTSLVSPMFTVLDYRVAYYMLMDVNQVSDNTTYKILYTFAPHFLILFAFTVSGACKIGLKNIAAHSGFWNNMYYYFSYKFGIITWDIMCMPIFANTVNLVNTINSPDLFMEKHFAALVIYFNVVLLIFYIYMVFLGSNPQIGQTPQKWQQYTQSQHYKLFQAFHGWTDAFDPLKRNHKFIFSNCRIVSLFLVTVTSSSLPNFLLQTGFLMYLLMVAPFKYSFFNVFMMCVRGLIILVYLFRFITDVYIMTSQQIVTSRDIQRILTVNTVIICTIIGVFYIMGIYEFYQKVRVFRMNVKAWKQKTKQAAIEQTKKMITPNKQDLNTKSKKSSISFIHNIQLQSPKRLKKDKQKQKNDNKKLVKQIKNPINDVKSVNKKLTPKKTKGKQSLLQSLTHGNESRKQ